MRTQDYLILFAPPAFVSQCQFWPSRAPSPLVFLHISTHFTAPHGIPSTSTILKLMSAPMPVQGWALGFDIRLYEPPTDALRPIIPDNACTLCITAAAGTELAGAYSSDTVRTSSLRKAVYAFCLTYWLFIQYFLTLSRKFRLCLQYLTVLFGARG